MTAIVAIFVSGVRRIRPSMAAWKGYLTMSRSVARRTLPSERFAARTATTHERLAKWVRRRPALAALFLLSAVSLLSLLALGSWYASRLQDAVQTAEELRKHAEQSQHLAEERERRVNRYLRYLYTSDLNLAYLAWDNADVRLTRELLGRHRHHLGRDVPPDFPWRYLWRLCQSDQLTLTGHDDDVYFVAFSPDGKTLVTAS